MVVRVLLVLVSPFVVLALGALAYYLATRPRPVDFSSYAVRRTGRRPSEGRRAPACPACGQWHPLGAVCLMEPGEDTKLFQPAERYRDGT